MFIKKKKFNNLCKYCGSRFLTGDATAYTCFSCREKITITCKCGCGKEFTRFKWRIDRNPYWYSHQHKGKTYKEIYGTATPKCGFPTGALNPNYNIPLKEASTQKLRDFYKNNPDAMTKRTLNRNDHNNFWVKNDAGESFRSTWEIVIDDFLKKQSFVYTREVPIKLIDGKTKIVDFLIEDPCGKIIIEVSGFSLAAYPEYTLNRFETLRKSVAYPLIIITTLDLITKVYKSDILPENLAYTCFKDEVRLFNAINFYQNINFVNYHFNNFINSVGNNYGNN